MTYESGMNWLRGIIHPVVTRQNEYDRGYKDGHKQGEEYGYAMGKSAAIQMTNKVMKTLLDENIFLRQICGLTPPVRKENQ